MELKAQVLKNQLNSNTPVEKTEVFSVKSDALFNLLSANWMELSLEQQYKVFPRALDILEKYCTIE